MTWWDKFVDAVASPLWAADILQATLGTAIAFGGAFLLFRNQLRHDRSLIDAQIAADAAARADERRAVTAEVLARELLRVADDYDNLGTSTWAQLLRKSAEPPSPERIRQADTTAKLLLDLDSLTLDLWRERLHTWNVMHRTVTDPGSNAKFATVDDLTLGLAIDNIMNPLQERLRFFAEKLIRWNGSGEPPGIEIFEGTWTPIPLRDHTLRRQWRAGTRHSFLGFVDQTVKRLSR